MDLSSLDEETIELILQLQVEDLEKISASADKGKQKANESTTFNSAIEDTKQELESFRANMPSRRLARAITNTNINIVDVKHVPPKSRLVEAKTIGGKSQNNLGDTTAGNEPIESFDKTQARFVNEPADSKYADTQPESSTWAVSRQTLLPERKYQCIACGDQKNPLDVTQCPCRHEYCQDCLQDLFKTSFTDESLFPPRCCRQQISAKENEHILSAEIVSKFEEKKIEFETTNRTYCQSPTCSAFIPPSSITETIGTCSQCDSKTCTICKGQPHEGECPNDPAIKALQELAAENGWQTCYNCHRIVELGFGCNHMTCPCGVQFCYVCGQKWRTCKCARWDENNLTERAQANVCRRNPQATDETDLARMFRRERRHLIENHECQHRNWRFTSGQHRCQECRDLMPTFAFECTQCHVMACRRCRDNRL